MKHLPVNDRVQELSIINYLDNIKGFGPVKFREVHKSYGSFSRFWEAFVNKKNDFLDYRKTLEPIIDKTFLEIIKKNSKDLSESKKFILDQIAKAENLGGKLIIYNDIEYPENLYNTNQCVPILYASKNTEILKEIKFCSVVGTRNPSDWSIIQTKKAVENLVSKHFVIVSGLAKGIDTTAHQTALDTNGKTIAVLGCGIDVFYPQENKDLQNEIKSKGLLVSEYPFGTRIQPVSLQKRDKIIVGLSKNTLIVETSQKGGTMNAYRAIIEQKKPLGIFVPPIVVTGSFDGNKKIIEERKTQLCCFSRGDDVNFETLKEC